MPLMIPQPATSLRGYPHVKGSLEEGRVRHKAGTTKNSSPTATPISMTMHVMHIGHVGMGMSQTPVLVGMSVGFSGGL